MKLLFDCDGTLIDSMGLWQKSMKELIKKSGHNLDTMSEYDRVQIESLSYADCIKYIWEHFVTGMSEKEVTAYFDNILENRYKNSIPEKKGAIETIKSLHERGYEMAVASSNSSALVKAALKRLGIHSQSIKNSNKNLIFFDDAGYALEAAKKAGIKTCGIKDFPLNENEWDAIKEIANYAVDGIGDFDYKSIQKVF